jgi:ferrous iron transport protein A
MKLTELEIGKSAVIKNVVGEGKLRRRLLEMGILPHTNIKIEKIAPFGDPIEIEIRGFNLSIRKEDANNIEVEVL